MKKLSIGIIGYGTAGQTAAVALSSDGHNVTVFERVANPGPIGAGFLLQPTGMSVLKQLGLHQKALALGRRIDRLYGENASGRPVMDMQYVKLNKAFFGLGLQRGAIYQILDGAWQESRDLRDGVSIEHVNTNTGYVIDTKNQQYGPFDLVVAADGAGSLLRNELPSVKYNKPYPWGALWCLLPESEWPHLNELRQRYRFANQMAGILPVGHRLDNDQAMLSFFWSMETSKFKGFDANKFVDIKQELLNLWPESTKVISALDSETKLAQANYRDSILGDAWFSGRMVAIGDCAHAMSPQLGQGVNMALLDAIALRNALALPLSLSTQLQHYSTERRKHVSIYQKWSCWLTPLFQSHNHWAASTRDTFLYPLGNLPIARTSMLKVLTGTGQGLFGKFRLDDEIE